MALTCPLLATPVSETECERHSKRVKIECLFVYNLCFVFVFVYICMCVCVCVCVRVCVLLY